MKEPILSRAGTMIKRERLYTQKNPSYAGNYMANISCYQFTNKDVIVLQFITLSPPAQRNGRDMSLKVSLRRLR